MLTELLRIGVNVGRTGALNPYAVLEPVVVGGVTVSLATLHNEEDINRKDIREGDTVIVQRAGDVIPQVVGPHLVEGDKRKRHRPWKMPANCPACDTPVVKVPGEVMHRCPNRACPAKGLQWLKHFVSRGAMDIDGVGEKLVARLLELGLITRPHDLYGLTVDDLLALEGFQERSAENVIASIERSKSRPFGNVLFALGIPHVGFVNAQLLADEFGSVDELAHAAPEQIAAIEGVGPVIAEAVSSWFLDEEHAEVVEGLRRAGVQLSGTAPRARARGPADREDGGRDGLDRGLYARLDPRAPGGAGREGDRLGLEEDRLPGGRRGRRLEAGEGRAAGRGGRLAGASWRRSWRAEPAQPRGRLPASACTIRSCSLCAARMFSRRWLTRIENTIWWPLRLCT